MPALLSRSLRHVDRSWLRPTVRLATIAGLALAVHALLVPDVQSVGRITDMADGRPWNLAIALGLYAALLAIPFVPGAEIGIALMVVFGSAAVLPVYLATITALSISFLVGRFASQTAYRGTHDDAARPSLFEDDLIARLQTRRWLQPLKRFRWLVVIVLINTPGNTVIGGGGGIAMAIGYSRAFRFPAFVACVALAVAPVPLVVFLAEQFGFAIGLGQWVQGLYAFP